MLAKVLCSVCVDHLLPARRVELGRHHARLGVELQHDRHAAGSRGGHAAGDVGLEHDGGRRGDGEPNGQQTAFTFEYGTTTAFGSLSAIDSAGSTSGAQAVSLQITGLSPSTTYRLRIVATNAAGTTTGSVASFTTSEGT